MKTGKLALYFLGIMVLVAVIDHYTHLFLSAALWQVYVVMGIGLGVMYGILPQILKMLPLEIAIKEKSNDK